MSVKQKQRVKFGWKAGRLLLVPNGVSSKKMFVEKVVLSDIMLYKNARF